MLCRQQDWLVYSINRGKTRGHLLCRYLALSPHVRLLLRSQVCCRPTTVSVLMAHFVPVVHRFTLPLSQMLFGFLAFWLYFISLCLKPIALPLRAPLLCKTNLPCLHHSELQYSSSRKPKGINTSDCTKKKTQQTTTHTYIQYEPKKTRWTKHSQKNVLHDDICRSTAPKSNTVRFCSIIIHCTSARHTCQNPERQLTYTPS